MPECLASCLGGAVNSAHFFLRFPQDRGKLALYPDVGGAACRACHRFVIYGFYTAGFLSSHLSSIHENHAKLFT
jgi:hypothetical protein